LHDSRLVDDGYLTRRAINSMLQEHLSKKFDHGNRLWLLLNAEVWYRMFINNESRESMKELLDIHLASTAKY